MKEYSGAVAYIDILGIGPLTRGEIQLTRQDFDAFGIALKDEGLNRHLFAASLLVAFRRALQQVRQRHKQVKVSQLSDSAFLWSTSPLAALKAARDVMWFALRAGVLCRGGLAFGGVIEPDKVNRHIGAFVLGEAVTKAVELERSGRGCRIFADRSLRSEIARDRSGWRDVSWGTQASDAPFCEIANPLDGSVVGEFRWYLQRAPKVHNSAHEVDFSEREERLLALVELVANLRLSPLFRWNASAPLGLQHLGVAVEAISSYTKQFGPGIDCFQTAAAFISHPPLHRSTQLVRAEVASKKRIVRDHCRSACAS